MSPRISVTVPDGLDALVSAIAEESGKTDEVPVLSKARVFRLLATDGANRLITGEMDVHGADFAEEVDVSTFQELIPDHALARYLRDEALTELPDVEGYENYEL